MRIKIQNTKYNLKNLNATETINLFIEVIFVVTQYINVQCIYIILIHII